MGILGFREKEALGKRVELGAYYRSATRLYEVDAVGANGTVVLRDCITEGTKGLGIEEFRRAYWLVRGPGR